MGAANMVQGRALSKMNFRTGGRWSKAPRKDAQVVSEVRILLRPPLPHDHLTPDY
ncbi:MAG: hypothetical protein Udaeo2_20580 [Candidatus Udaeobacter sp.]|nr:MAG: hypothetical protein Udaeo2_20580 [Candidatus Udaeobacter sp.]